MINRVLPSYMLQGHFRMQQKCKTFTGVARALQHTVYQVYRAWLIAHPALT